MRALLLLLITRAAAFADGGAVILHERTQALTVTVFATPAPPRAGSIDMSVLVQSTDTLEPVLDAQVWLRFVKPGARSREVEATHSQANNKLLYAANLRLDDPGDWQVSVDTHWHGGASAATASGSLTITPAQPQLGAYIGYLTLPFLALSILSLHQWLKFRLDRRYASSARLNPEMGARGHAVRLRLP